MVPTTQGMQGLTSWSRCGARRGTELPGCILFASRLPRNAVGWLFCALGLGLIPLILSQEYAIRALVRVANPGSARSEYIISNLLNA